MSGVSCASYVLVVLSASRDLIMSHDLIRRIALGVVLGVAGGLVVGIIVGVIVGLIAIVLWY
jgi:hypothetical protein